MQNSMAKNIWAYNERQQYYLASLLETNVFEIHVFFITIWRKDNKLIIYSPRKIEKNGKKIWFDPGSNWGRSAC